MNEEEYNKEIEKEVEMQYYRRQLLYKFILVVFAVACITMIVSSTITYTYVRKKFSGANIQLNSILPIRVDQDDNNKITDNTISTITDDLSQFTDLINTYYKGDIDKTKLATETIKGYINGLGDKYSEYFTKEDLEEFEMSALGNYYGIGISMLTNDDGNIEVAQVFDKTPAQEVGIQIGDVIAAINDESYLGKTPEEASKVIKGDENTKVNLTLLRGAETIQVEVERREVKIYHVSSKMIDDKVGYIFLYTFDSNCSDEVRTALEELKEQGAEKFILDLRYNTGGLVDEAVSIASLFVEKGTPVYYMLDSGDKETPMFTREDPIDTESPIVILLNNYSASASEILAGCLKDRRNATLVGLTTYGKGVMQNLFQLLDGSALKLTFAEYLTPNKTHINEVGIAPDYEVELPKDAKIDPDGEESENDTQLEKAIEVINEK